MINEKILFKPISAVSEEDALMQQAIALSRQETSSAAMPDFSSMTEEEQLNYALQMSIAQANLPSSETPATSSATLDADILKFID